MVAHLARQPKLGWIKRGQFWLGLICSLMAIFVVFAMFSPYFQLKKITVLRDSPHIDTEAIENSLSDFFGKNLLFIDQDQAKNQLRNDFPILRDITLNQKLPHTLELKLTLSPPKFSLLNDEDASFWVVSEDGVILQPEAQEALPLIKLLDYPKPIQVGRTLIAPQLVDAVVNAQTIFTQDLGLNLKESRILLAAQELHLESDQGTVFWIDLQLPIIPQLEKINLSADEIGVYRQKLEHVDLRIPNRIFWKK